MTKTVRAKLKYLKIAPKKVRPAANVIKGMPVERAIAELESRGRRSNPALLGLLRSALANAVNVRKMERDALVVKSVLVDPGPPYKRILPRAMGRATPLWKRTSHVTLILEEKEGVNVASPRVIRKEASREAPSIEAAPAASEFEERRKPRIQPPKKEVHAKKPSRGFMPKIFQRKAI